MTPNHNYPLRISKDLWSDLTAIKKVWNTSHKALMTEACIDLVKKKQMELPKLRKARTTIHSQTRNI
jgi:uncharacterized protein YbdZ (MbtH family)